MRAVEEPSGEAYDAVVIGGGHNGLACAAYLAGAGRSVLVLERTDVLGGAARSEQVFAGHDANLSKYSYLVSLLPQLVVDELGLDVTLQRREVSSYTPRGDGGVLVDAADPVATAASLGADADAWDELYAMTARVAERVFPTLTEPLRDRDALRRHVGDDAAWTALVERPIGELIERPASRRHGARHRADRRPHRHVRRRPRPRRQPLLPVPRGRWRDRPVGRPGRRDGHGVGAARRGGVGSRAPSSCTGVEVTAVAMDDGGRR